MIAGYYDGYTAADEGKWFSETTPAVMTGANMPVLPLGPAALALRSPYGAAIMPNLFGAGSDTILGMDRNTFLILGGVALFLLLFMRRGK